MLYHCVKGSLRRKALSLLLSTLFSLVFKQEGLAQLPFFTQYQQNQLNVNPAFAGYFDEEIKWSGIYRSQAYSQVVTSKFYNTSLQMRPYFTFVPENDEIGFGINAYSNKTLDVFSHQSVSGTLSYSKGLNFDGTQSITVGFQGRYNTKRIDYTGLLFPNQFDVIGYTNALPNNEPIQIINVNYFDVNTGVMYQMVNEFESFVAGISVYNVNQASSFKTNLANRYPQTFNYHVGYSRFTSDYTQLFLGALHSTMGKQNTTSLVAAYQYFPDLDKSVGLDAGAIYTINHSISPYMTIHTGPFRTSFTYNIPINPNISYLRNANSFELGFQYLFTQSEQDTRLARKHMSCF